MAVRTGERLAKLETKVDNLTNEIIEVKEMLKSALEGKANKWVEVWMYGVIFAIIGAGIGFFAWLVQKGII